MSITNLCTATSDALTHNGRTTVSLINAYRAGGTRLLGLVDNGWAQLVNRGGSRLSEQRRQNLVAIEQQLSGYYQKGLDVLSTQSTRAVNAVSMQPPMASTSWASRASASKRSCPRCQ